MIESSDFIKTLKDNDISCFSGVPDSVLHSFCLEIENFKGITHVRAAHESQAVSFCLGYYIGNKKIACAYLQNSGLGNIINPLVSIADENVYKIPLLLLIGWRGEILNGEQIKDEPQHLLQGSITEKQLELIGIKYEIMEHLDSWREKIKNLLTFARTSRKPVALLIRHDFFKRVQKKTKNNIRLPSREEVVEKIYKCMDADSCIVLTTGKTGREFLKIHQKYKKNINFFINIGGMGLTSSLCSGLSTANKYKKIYCIDGDGAILMHPSSLLQSANCNKIIHVLIKNGVHESVGGQKISNQNFNFMKHAANCGYKKTEKLKIKDIEKKFKNYKKFKNSIFVEIATNKSSDNNLPRLDVDLKNFIIKKI